VNVLDESEAWDLVREIRGAGGVTTAQRRSVPGSAGLSVDVEPTGRWRVSDGVRVEDAARRILDLFLPLLARPELVIGQLAQGVDGRIATEAGHSHYVTGPEDLGRLHRLRALADAVVVGAGTVASDDPQLTVRRVKGDNPVRVVLDPDGRLDPDRALFTDGAAPTVVIRRRGADTSVPPGVQLLHLPAGEEGGPEDPPHGTGDIRERREAGERDRDRQIQPAVVVAALRERGHRWILVEGGGVTVSRFLRDGVLDRLHVAVAPLLMGSGRPALTLDPIETLDQALRPPCRHVALGDDILFDFDLRGGAG